MKSFKEDLTARRNEAESKADARGVIMGERKLKSEVNFRYADEDSPKRCSECKYYVNAGQPQSDCEKVVGQVYSNGVCDLWEQNPVPPSSSDPDRDGDNDEEKPDYSNTKKTVIQLLVSTGPGQ